MRPQGAPRRHARLPLSLLPRQDREHRRLLQKRRCLNRRFDHWPQVKHHAGSQPELSHREGLGLCCCPAHTASPCVWPLQPRSLGTSDSRLNRQAAPAVRSAPGMRVAFGAWILSSPSQGEKNARLPSVTSSGVATGAYRADGALVPNPNAAAPHARTGEGRGALGQGLGPRPAPGTPGEAAQRVASRSRSL